MLSSEHRLYDPAHYNMGAVWPFVTGFVAWGHYTYDRPWAGFPLVHALARLTFDWARGRHPELLSGDLYRPLDEAVPQQFFASSMLVTPLLRGVIGWNATPRPVRRDWPPRSRRSGRAWRCSACAQATRAWTRRSSRGRSRCPSHSWAPARPSTWTSRRCCPPGQRTCASIASGREENAPRPSAGTPPLEHASRCAFASDATPTTVRFSWEGGLSVSPAVFALEPGQRSERVRVTDVSWDERAQTWSLTVAGPRGTTHDVRVYGAAVRSLDAAAETQRDGPVTTLRVRLPDGGAAATSSLTVKLVPAR